MEEVTSEGDEVQPSYRFWQTLIVLYQPPEARCPRKIALYYPSSRQKHKAAPGLRVLDHFQADAMLRGLLRWLLSTVALVHVSQLHLLAGGLLNGTSQLFDLPSVLLVGWRNVQGEQMS